MHEPRYRRRDDRKYEVVVEDAVVGLVWRERVRRAGVGRPRISQQRSGHFNPPGDLWICDPANAAISDDDRELVRRYINRNKTTRKGATKHLLDAYEAADVPLPSATD